MIQYDYADVLSAFSSSKKQYFCYRAEDLATAKRITTNMQRRILKMGLTGNVEAHRFKNFVIVEKAVG